MAPNWDDFDPDDDVLDERFDPPPARFASRSGGSGDNSEESSSRRRKASVRFQGMDSESQSPRNGGGGYGESSEDGMSPRSESARGQYIEDDDDDDSRSRSASSMEDDMFGKRGRGGRSGAFSDSQGDDDDDDDNSGYDSDEVEGDRGGTKVGRGGLPMKHFELPKRLQLPKKRDFAAEGYLQRQKGNWKKKWTKELFVIHHGVLMTCSSTSPFLVKLCVPLNCITQVAPAPQVKKRKKMHIFEVHYLAAGKGGKSQLTQMNVLASSEQEMNQWVERILNHKKRAAKTTQTLTDLVDRDTAKNTIIQLHDAMRNAGLYGIATRIFNGIQQHHKVLLEESFIKWREFSTLKKVEVMRTAFEVAKSVTESELEQRKKELAKEEKIAERLRAVATGLQRLDNFRRRRMQGYVLGMQQAMSAKKSTNAIRHAENSLYGAMQVNHTLAAIQVVEWRWKKLKFVLDRVYLSTVKSAFDSIRVESWVINAKDNMKRQAVTTLIVKQRERDTMLMHKAVSDWRSEATRQRDIYKAIRVVLATRRMKLEAAIVARWAQQTFVERNRLINGAKLLERIFVAHQDSQKAHSLRLWTYFCQEVQISQALQICSDFSQAQNEFVVAYDSLPVHRAVYHLDMLSRRIMLRRKLLAFTELRRHKSRVLARMCAIRIGLDIVDAMHRRRISNAFTRVVKFTYSVALWENRKFSGAMQLGLCWKGLQRKLITTVLLRMKSFDHISAEEREGRISEIVDDDDELLQTAADGVDEPFKIQVYGELEKQVSLPPPDSAVVAQRGLATETGEAPSPTIALAATATAAKRPSSSGSATRGLRSPGRQKRDVLPLALTLQRIVTRRQMPAFIKLSTNSEESSFMRGMLRLEMLQRVFQLSERSRIATLSRTFWYLQAVTGVAPAHSFPAVSSATQAKLKHEHAAKVIEDIDATVSRVEKTGDPTEQVVQSTHLAEGDLVRLQRGEAVSVDDESQSLSSSRVISIAEGRSRRLQLAGTNAQRRLSVDSTATERRSPLQLTDAERIRYRAVALAAQTAPLRPAPKRTVRMAASRVTAQMKRRNVRTRMNRRQVALRKRELAERLDILSDCESGVIDAAAPVEELRGFGVIEVANRLAAEINSAKRIQLRDHLAIARQPQISTDSGSSWRGVPTGMFGQHMLGTVSEGTEETSSSRSGTFYGASRQQLGSDTAGGASYSNPPRGVDRGGELPVPTNTGYRRHENRYHQHHHPLNSPDLDSTADFSRRSSSASTTSRPTALLRHYFAGQRLDLHPADGLPLTGLTSLYDTAASRQHYRGFQRNQHNQGYSTRLMSYSSSAPSESNMERDLVPNGAQLGGPSDVGLASRHLPQVNRPTVTGSFNTPEESDSAVGTFEMHRWSPISSIDLGDSVSQIGAANASKHHQSSATAPKPLPSSVPGGLRPGAAPEPLSGWAANFARHADALRRILHNGNGDAASDSSMTSFDSHRHGAFHGRASDPTRLSELRYRQMAALEALETKRLEEQRAAVISQQRAAMAVIRSKRESSKEFHSSDGFPGEGGLGDFPLKDFLAKEAARSGVHSLAFGGQSRTPDIAGRREKPYVTRSGADTPWRSLQQRLDELRNHNAQHGASLRAAAAGGRGNIDELDDSFDTSSNWRMSGSPTRGGTGERPMFRGVPNHQIARAVSSSTGNTPDDDDVGDSIGDDFGRVSRLRLENHFDTLSPFDPARPLFELAEGQHTRPISDSDPGNQNIANGGEFPPAAKCLAAAEPQFSSKVEEEDRMMKERVGRAWTGTLPKARRAADDLALRAIFTGDITL